MYTRLKVTAKGNGNEDVRVERSIKSGKETKGQLDSGTDEAQRIKGKEECRLEG